jgi:hypothetical protein
MTTRKALLAAAYLLHVAFLMEPLAALLERANKGTISTVEWQGERGNDKYLTLIAQIKQPTSGTCESSCEC